MFLLSFSEIFLNNIQQFICHSFCISALYRLQLIYSRFLYIKDICHVLYCESEREEEEWKKTGDESNFSKNQNFLIASNLSGRSIFVCSLL